MKLSGNVTIMFAHERAFYLRKISRFWGKSVIASRFFYCTRSNSFENSRKVVPCMKIREVDIHGIADKFNNEDAFTSTRRRNAPSLAKTKTFTSLLPRRIASRFAALRLKTPTHLYVRGLRRQTRMPDTRTDRRRARGKRIESSRQRERDV